MSTLIHIGLGFGIALCTSIPFGSINLMIADYAITRNKRAAIWAGFGAALVQIIQAFACLKFSILLNKDPQVNRIFIISSIPVLIILGIYFWYKQPKKKQVVKSKKEDVKGFGKGALISSFNMVILPFFVFVGGYLGPSKWFYLDNYHILMFSFGTFMGSFLIFIAYAQLGALIRKKFKTMSHNFSNLLALLMFAIAIWQILRLTRLY